MAYRSVTDNFFLSRGVRRLSCREARWLYSFLVPKAGTYGIFYELPERLQAEFEFTEREWEGAYKGLTSPSKGASPRLFHQPEDSLWFLREQFEEQTIKKGGASPNHIIGLCKVFNNLPEGLVKQAFKEKYGGLIFEGAIPAPTLPPTGGAMTDPPPKGKERKGNKKENKTKTLLSENQNFSDDVIFLTSFLISKIKFNDPKAKTPPMVNESENGNKERALADPAFRKWATEMDRLISLDKREVPEIEKVIIWCQDDSFWKSNILSAGKLRKQFQQLVLKMRNIDWVQPVKDQSIEARFDRALGDK